VTTLKLCIGCNKEIRVTKYGKFWRHWLDSRNRCINSQKSVKDAIVGYVMDPLFETTYVKRKDWKINRVIPESLKRIV
jgi:hypothetical protein